MDLPRKMLEDGPTVVKQAPSSLIVRPSPALVSNTMRGGGSAMDLAHTNTRKALMRVFMRGAYDGEKAKVGAWG